MSAPLVSVGIPTYRRPREVERAVRSVLAQDHPNLEVVVADDASADETADVLRAIGDPRLRVIVHERNIGHARNFDAVRSVASGEYFMWLSDDDWIDPAYVSSCVAALAADPALGLVCGRALYERPGAPEPQLERATNLLSPSPFRRVLEYFATVDVNGPLYGVGRLADRPPFREVLGGDWIVVGALAYRGRVRTLEGVHVHRSLAGMSTEAGFAVREFGVRGNPHLVGARNFARAIWSDEPAFADLPAPQRALLAASVAAVTGPRFVLIDLVRAALDRTGLLPFARRLIAPLRARRHAS